MKILKYPIIIYPYKKLLYTLAFLIFLMGICLAAIIFYKNIANLDGIMASLTAFLCSLGVAYWAYNMKIVIYEDHFYQYSFLPAKKIFFKDVVKMKISHGHNGPFSPINMTQLTSSTGVKAEINNHMYKHKDIQLLLSLIDESEQKKPMIYTLIYKQYLFLNILHQHFYSLIFLIIKIWHLRNQILKNIIT